MFGNNKYFFVITSGGITSPFSQFSFVTSERGRNLLLYLGCKFCFHRALVGGDQRWKCTTKHCTAYLKYNPNLNTLTKIQAEHNHPPPEPTKLERQLLSNEAKRQAVTMELGVKEVIQDVMTEEGVSMSNEDVKRIKVNICRAKRLSRVKQNLMNLVTVEEPSAESESSQDRTDMDSNVS